MTVRCIDSGGGHDARLSWPGQSVASAPVRGGGEFALPPAFATGPRCLLARVLEEGENWGPGLGEIGPPEGGGELGPWRGGNKAHEREN